jgi:hypothetical protein
MAEALGYGVQTSGLETCCHLFEAFVSVLFPIVIRNEFHRPVPKPNGSRIPHHMRY